MPLKRRGGSNANQGKAPAKRGRPKAKVDDEEDEAEFLLKLELIELVQGYPEIYDIASLKHKKEYLQNLAWKNISEALFLPGRYKINLVYSH